MRRMVVAALFAAASPAYAQLFSGEWREYSLVGDRQWDEGRCAISYILERRYNMLTDANAPRVISGGYSAIVHGRMYRNLRGDCRVPGQVSRAPIFEMARLWSLWGFSTGSEARVQGNYGNCIGDSCADPTVDRRNFIFRLKVDGDVLIDRDEAVPQVVRATYHRDQWHQIRNREALAGLDEILAVLREGSRDQVRLRLSPLVPSQQVEEFLTSLPITRTALAAVASRETVECYVFDAPVTGGVWDRAAMIMQQVNGTDGTKALEMIFLNHVQTWRLANILRY